MPRMDGLEATRRLAGPGVVDPLRVVVVTTFDLDEYVHTALRNGAAGFLLKDAGPTLLLEAVRAATAATSSSHHRSPSVCSRTSARRLLPTEPFQPVSPLTDREEEVLRAAAHGRSNTEIAQELFISLGTVKSHLSSLQDKIGARNRVELAAFAWQSGRMCDEQTN